MTRRETPSRHGRAADALIASYVRELVADDEVRAASDAVSAAASRSPADARPAPLHGSPAGAASADATL